MFNKVGLASSVDNQQQSEMLFAFCVQFFQVSRLTFGPIPPLSPPFDSTEGNIRHLCSEARWVSETSNGTSRLHWSDSVFGLSPLIDSHSPFSLLPLALQTRTPTPTPKHKPTNRSCNRHPTSLPGTPPPPLSPASPFPHYWWRAPPKLHCLAGERMPQEQYAAILSRKTFHSHPPKSPLPSSAAPQSGRFVLLRLQQTVGGGGVPETLVGTV